MNAYHELSSLSDAVVYALAPLREGPDWEPSRQRACDAIDALHAAIGEIASREDAMLSIMPACPVGALTKSAIMGRLPYEVTRDVIKTWVADLDKWASEIDRIAELNTLAR